MESQADLLRRRIALYRRYLREGTDEASAAEYLRQILQDEAALAIVERFTQRNLRHTDISVLEEAQPTAGLRDGEGVG